MMKTLTIPKSLTGRDDLVVLPRRDYEQLVSDSAKETIKRDPKIDRALTISMREFKEGKVEGPFENARDFMAFLRRKPKRPRAK